MVFHSFASSKICLRVKMWSQEDLPLRKPICFLRISLSRVAKNSSSITLMDFFLLRLKRVKPLQLFESNRSPSFKTFRSDSLPIFKHFLGYPDFPEKLRKDGECQIFFCLYQISLYAVYSRRFTIIHLAVEY